MMTFLFSNPTTNIRAYIDTTLLRANYKCSNNKFLIMDSGFTTSLEYVDYEKSETVLTEEEINILCNHNGEDLTEIIAKLESPENTELLQKVQEEEKECIMKRYDITRQDLDNILSHHHYKFVDRNIVDSIHEDLIEFGYYVAVRLDLIDPNDETKATYYADYFDFVRLGRDTLNSSPYCHELKDGRIFVLVPQATHCINCHL